MDILGLKGGADLGPSGWFHFERNHNENRWNSVKKI